MIDDLWADYLNALRRLVVAVKLTAFWTEETAKATRETAYYTEETARNVREYLARRELLLLNQEEGLFCHLVKPQSDLESKQRR